MNNLVTNQSYKTIIDTSKEFGGKGANLLFLRGIQSDVFIVPQFITVSDFSEDNIKNVASLFEGKLVAVRSSGIQEDSKESSLAGSFHTELNVASNQIGEAIKRIHQHSIAKANEQIPVVIQEMVPSQNSGVVFTYDVDERKPYFVINIGDGLGESLVSGEQTGQTYKILSGINPELIPNQRIRNLYKAISLISSKYPTPYIDVEFGFVEGNDTPYILQVRPIVGITPDSYSEHAKEVAIRYARLIHQNLARTGEFYGNMIDINPEELVGNQPEIVKSFFDAIFPRSSLLEARKYLGYKGGLPIMELPNYHPYISLGRDLRLFLPSELPEDVVLKFIRYYKGLLVENPGIQNSLDALHYPNTLEQVNSILDKLEMSRAERDNTVVTFVTFFSHLEERLFEFEKTLGSRLSDIFSQLSDITGKEITTIADLIQIDYGVIQKEHIGRLIELIKELTFIFTIVARGAFYFNNKDPEIDQNYFKSNKYETTIKEYMIGHGLERMNFELTDGFNFLSKVTSEYTTEGLGKLVDSKENEGEINPTSRFMVYRENIKFIFSRLFLILNYSIPEETDLSQFVDFTSFIKSLSLDNSDSTDSKRKKHDLRSVVDNILIFPSVAHAQNSPIFLKLNTGDAHFIGNGIISGDILYIATVSELAGIGLHGKIICIENATPEIDIFLPNIDGIITRNGGPLAHIAIRAREYKIPSVIGTGQLFDKIKNFSKINIDFDNQEIIES